jgi:hypothetical protein
MLQKIVAVGVMVILPLVVGARNRTPSLAERSQKPSPLWHIDVNPGETFDDALARLNEEVPGFGGLFLDETGRLTVYLVGGEEELPLVRARLLPKLVRGGERVVGDIPLHVLPARYRFAELKKWNDRLMGPVLSLPGTILTDVDEASNRLRIGVENSEAAKQVEAELARLGVPSEAVIIEEMEPIVMLATLRDRVRPLEGGLQINFPGFLCTYGFNATRAGVAGFVTNSHCTSTQGGVENTPYWQPLQNGDTFIGTETVDPVYTRSKCPLSLRGRVCRYSDSAFAQLATTEFSRGFIEQTSEIGSLTIVGSFRIVTEASAVNGQVINKVGRTTGWTQGTQTNTCVNVSVSGSNIVQLCQNMVQASSVIVGAGDSGSPAFRIQSGTDVALVGILWGGNQSGTLFVYSPIANIQRSDELGPLTTCWNGSC